jgi:ABC-type amino acid transport substrate-binding protein
MDSWVRRTTVVYALPVVAAAGLALAVGSVTSPSRSIAGDVTTIEVIPGGTLDGIKAGKPLRVCADPRNLPFSSDTADEPGFDVELARLVAEELGTKPAFVWIPTGWGRRAVSRLVDAECDVFPGLPVDPRFDMGPRLAMSDPYYVLGHVLVVPAVSEIKTVEDLQRKTLSVEVASVADDWALKRGLARHIYPRFRPEEAFKAIADKQADAGLMWTAVAGYGASKSPELGLRLIEVTGPDLQFGMGFAMRKRDSDLRAAINAALERIGRDRVAAILARYGVTSATAAAATGTQPGAPVQAPVPPPRAPEVESREGEMGAGQIFAMCSPCHGLNARGGGIVPSLKETKLTDSEFVKTVLKGRPGTPMRPYKGLLTEKQILSVREHIRVKIRD